MAAAESYAEDTDRLEHLGGLDAAFLALETDRVHLHVATVLVLEQPFGRRSLFSPDTWHVAVRRLVEQRLHLAPPLRKRMIAVPLGLDRPVWVDDPELDLDAHVRRARLPAPGAAAQLEALVGELVGAPLPADRPLWEMVVVEGLEDGRTAIVVKVHHALLDGWSGAELLATFLDAGPRPPPVLPAPVEWSPPALPGLPTLLRETLRGLVRQPEALLSAAQQVVEAGLDLAARPEETDDRGSPPRPFHAPRTAFNGSVSSRRRFSSATVPLAEVRDVSGAWGTTINDVVLAAVTGALRQTLIARRQEVPESLVAMVPISVRSDGDRDQLANQLGGTLVALPTGLDDPIERLLAVAEAAASAKQRAEQLGDRFVMRLAEAVPPGLAGPLARWASSHRLYDRVAPPANVIVSNIRGPSEALWCAGSRVAALYPVGPVADGVGLNLTVLSYCGHLSLGVVACQRLNPDAGDLPRYWGRCLHELSESTQLRRGRAG